MKQFYNTDYVLKVNKTYLKKMFDTHMALIIIFLIVLVFHAYNYYK